MAPAGISAAAKAAVARLKAVAAAKRQQKDHLANTSVYIYGSSSFVTG